MRGDVHMKTFICEHLTASIAISLLILVIVTAAAFAWSLNYVQRVYGSRPDISLINMSMRAKYRNLINEAIRITRIFFTFAVVSTILIYIIIFTI